MYVTLRGSLIEDTYIPKSLSTLSFLYRVGTPYTTQDYTQHWFARLGGVGCVKKAQPGRAFGRSLVICGGPSGGRSRLSSTRQDRKEAEERREEKGRKMVNLLAFFFL